MATSQAQPPRPPAPPAPPRSGSNILAIVLLGLALIVVVSGLVVWFGLHYLSHNIRVSEHESEQGKKQVAISTPFGGLHVNTGKAVTEASLRLPIYPGAMQVKNDDSATVSLGLPGANSVGIVVGKFESSDPLDKVEKFYHDRLGSEVTKFTERDNEGKTVFEIKQKDDERVVALKSTDGGTRIELVHVGHAQGETSN